MKAKVLMTLLLSALSQPLLAGDSVFIGVTLQVAQLSPEERRALRERWEMASPEERMDMRRRFQERMQPALPEERPARRRDNEARRESWAPHPPADFGGFGTGFERRQPNLPTPPEVIQEFDPRTGYPYPGGRHRR